MPLPNPDRNLPDTLDTGPPGPTGAAYADEVAAEVERIWDLVPNVLINVGGSADAITAECDPPLIKDIRHGQRFWLVPAANNTGGVTIDIDSRGAVDVLAFDGTPLEADDLVAGEGVELAGYVTASPPHIEIRLPHPTARQLLAAASAGGSQMWEQIGDSGNLTTMAQVEFTFTAGRYSKVVVLASDMNCSQGTVALRCSLRHSAGSIVSLATNIVNTNEVTAEFSFAIGLVASTKVHVGSGRYANPSGANPDELIDAAGGSNAAAPDRVRVDFSAGNIDAGRVMAYGLLATEP